MIQSFGHVLLPGLGSTPLSAEQTSRMEVLELVSFLSSMPTLDAKYEANMKVDHELNKHIHAYVQTVDGATRNSQAQCSGDYMTRWPPGEIRGEWVPLEESVLRIRSVIKCIEPVWLSNADGINVHCARGSLVKIIHKIGDGDIRVALSTEAQVSDLHIALERHWFLRDSFKGCELWLHHGAIVDEARLKREI